MLFGVQSYAQVSFGGAGGAIPSAGTAGSDDYTAMVAGPAACAAGDIELTPGSVTIAGPITVTLADVSHTFASDIEIDLISPAGTSISLFWDDGGATGLDAGGCTIVLTDGTGNDPDDWDFVGDVPDPCAGDVLDPSLEPQGGGLGLDDLIGEDAEGTWTLRVNDDAGGDTGSFASWTVDMPNTMVVEAVCATPGCSLECPESVIVSTTDPGSDCSAFVTIPQPLNNSGCDLSTLTNDYNGTTDASDTYPLGTTTVTYSIIDAATGLPVSCTVDVVVVDNTPPTFTCPGDMTINLDAGECEAILDFNISADDECATSAVTVTTNNTFTAASISNSVGCPGGGYQTLLAYDLPSMGITEELLIESVDFGIFQIFGSVNLTVNVYSIASAPGASFNYTDLTLLGTGTQLFGASGNAIGNIPVVGTIPAGSVVVLELIAPNGTFTNGFVPGYNNAGLTSGVTYLASTFCNVANPLDVGMVLGGFTDVAMMQLNAVESDPTLPVDADPANPFANGDALPIGGPYTFTYTAQDDAGNVATCTFDVTIQEYPNPSGSLTCNAGGNQISLDDNCEAIVGADDILEGGNYGCYDDYLVELFFDAALTQPVPTSPLLTSQNIGQTIYVRVTDVEQPQNNSCWTWITVEDKIIPALECTDTEIRCNDSTAPGTVIPGGTGTATVTEGGSWASTADIDNTFGISAVGTVTDVNISLDITHTWVGDVVVEVIAPDGTSVTVLNGSCGNTDDINVTFDDESANPFACGAGIPVLGGDMMPENALSGFDGVDANGDWTVNVSDGIGGDGGNINAITLEVSYSGAEVPFPLPATAFISPQNIANGQPYTVIGFDPCGPVTLTFEDNEVAGDCVADDYIKQIIRSWTAVDASGNEATCDQVITIGRQTIADVEFPRDRDGLDLDYLQCNNIDDDAFLDDVDGNVLVDENGHPHPDVTGYPNLNGQDIESGDNCEFGVTYEDVVIPICEGTYKLIRTWTVLAWCPTTDIATGVQIIKVVDDQGPDLVCADDQTISTGQNDCTASAIIAYPSVSDACGTASFVSVSVSNGTLNAAQTAVFGLPLGVTTVTFTYIDGCGNESTCSYEITVTDQVPPVAICESFHVVGLTIDEPTLVPALVFDDGSYDNCELVEYQVRRMDNPNCPGFDGTPFGDYAPFYCCDVGGPNVMVELRVRDAAGNTNSCMVEVEVQDKLNPAIQCPPNKVLDCYDDPYDLDLTGEATASDNCSAVVTYFDNGSLDNCGEGTIFRIWTATDPGGRTASCVQRIDVINSEPFEICDERPWNTPVTSSCDAPNFPFVLHTFADGVEWPADVELSTCGPGLLPEDLEGVVNINDVRPRIFEDGCDLVGVTYEDVYLPITAPACVKVLRTWKVYDWCTFDADDFDPNNPTASEGYWEYTQVIKVLNSAAPTITSDCNDVSFCSYDPNCQIGPATLLLAATDDCTDADDLNYYYWIDIDNDGGNDIHATGADASGNYPIGTHSILWHVEDGCGNVAMCEYNFVIADCKNPTPNLLNGIATEMMEDCMIEIWAVDWDNPSSPSFDNCGIQEWRVQSPSQGPGQTTPPATASASWTFSGAADLGTNTVDVWILDVNGNWSYVSTYILVQDNLAPFCGTQASISGEVNTEEAQDVSSAMIMLEGGAPGLPEYDEMETGTDGLFGFPGLANGGNYVVTPEKDINPLNGVSTFDLVKISQHILEVDLLPSPYKIISADINHDGNVSTVDLVQLRRLILFIDTEFQNNTSWRFVEASFAFNDPTDPFASNFPEVYTVNGLSQEEIADFVAMKIGDVNCSASPNGLTGGADDRTVGELTFGIQDEQMKAGEAYTVDFTAKDFASVYGYQFTLGFDNAAVEFEGIEAGALTNLTDANFGMAMINEGVITTSWNNSTAVSMDADDVLFSITFTANTNAQLSDVLSVNSRYTKAEAYDNNGLLDINVEFNSENGVTVAGGAFELYQNQPNPFKAETNIGFNLPEAGFATLTIYDVSGRVLRTVEGDFAKGYNEVTLNRSEIAGTGVLYYQLDTENDSATKKMIIIK